MLTKEIIEQYKNKKPDFNLNFLILKTEKEELDKIAIKNKISTSLLLRILVKELIKEEKEN